MALARNPKPGLNSSGFGAPALIRRFFRAAVRIASPLLCAGGLAQSAQPPSGVPSATELFDWAERQYPQLFPGHRSNQTHDVYTYRFYPQSGNYVGVAGDDVYLLGPVVGHQLTKVGSRAAFGCQVHALDCADPPLARPVRRRTAAGDFDNNWVVSVDGHVLSLGQAPKIGPEAIEPIAGTHAQRVRGLQRVRAVHTLGHFTTFAVTERGEVWGWGLHYGQVDGRALRDRDFARVPQRVPGLDRIVELDMRCEAVALRDDGSVWYLHHDTSAGRTTVERVAGVNGAVALGLGDPGLGNSCHTTALLANGKLVRLSRAIEGNSYVVKATQTFNALPPARDVSCSAYHCLLLARDGAVWAWGQNSAGQLGDGTTFATSTPYKVPGLPPIRRVQACSEGSYALT